MASDQDSGVVMPEWKVLVAEDVPDIRDLICHSLKYAGYAVVEAKDGIEAIEKAETERPDLILLDVRMPKMDGYEACTVLKEMDATRDIPVLFLSARGQESEIRRGLALGAEEYILKPFAPDELYRRVGRILGRQGRSEPPPPSD
jgi:CheY-like chemotaxis protein